MENKSISLKRILKLSAIGFGGFCGLAVLFIIIGVALDFSTPTKESGQITPEQMTKAEELLRQKAVERRAVESSTPKPQQPEPPTVEITEIGCQRLLDELMAVAEGKSYAPTDLAKSFMLRKAVDAGLPVTNVPRDLPRFILPESLCGETLDVIANMIIEGAKMPSYIIK